MRANNMHIDRLESYLCHNIGQLKSAIKSIECHTPINRLEITIIYTDKGKKVTITLPKAS